MDVFEVTLPFSRLVAAAKVFGSQDTHFCPEIYGEDRHTCFRHRGLKPFLAESVEQPREYECTECWLRFFTNGD